MRAVLDTNVLVSALLSRSGTCAQILDLAVERHFAVCVDQRILDGYDRILHRPRLRIEAADASDVLEFMRVGASRVAAHPLRVELPHEDDRPFLEVAAAVEAVLVTGNKRHFPKRVCKSIRVLAPAEFLDLLRRPLAGRPRAGLH